MSTTISNAYIVNFSNSKKVEEINQKLRKLIKEAQIKYMANKIATEGANYFFYTLPFVVNKIDQDEKEKAKALEKSTLTNFVLENEYNDQEMLKLLINQLYDEKMTVPDIMKKLFVSVSDRDLNSNYNINMTIYFKSMGNKTYYILSGRHEIIKIFDEISTIKDEFTDYSYWNGSDGPDEFTHAQWEARGKRWDKIFKSTNYLYEAMDAILLRNNYLYVVNKQDILPHIPNEYTQFKKIFSKEDLNVNYKRMCEEQKEEYDIQLKNKKSDLSFFSDLFFQASKTTKDTIKSGEYMKYYDTYKNSLIPIDVLFDLVMNKKIRLTVETKDEDDDE